MMAPRVPTFEEFVRPLVGDVSSPPSDSTPLSKLQAGDYAVLAWLDDVQSRLPPDVETEIIARWNTMSLRDVYTMLVAGTDNSGAQSS